MTPSVAELAKHPDMLNKDTVFALREMVARYPYYQAARILFLKNLFLLHDVTFGEELRKASIFIGDRRVLFNMVEGDNYKLHADRATQEEVMDKTMTTGADRTESLIDRFLQNGMLAEDKDEEELPRNRRWPMQRTTIWPSSCRRKRPNQSRLRQKMMPRLLLEVTMQPPIGAMS